MNTVPDSHRAGAPAAVRCAVLTISDTRTEQTDRGGNTLCDHLQSRRHEIVARAICRDEATLIREQLKRWQHALDPDAILLTGGTGLTPRDQTFETLNALIDKPLPGYGELFRWLSFQQIGPAAMLSRAIGGLIGTTVVLSMPGSPAAVDLAMQQIILPELGHLVQQARQG